jgi:hypothetical protein
LNAPRRHLGVFLLADEVKLGGADVAVPREFCYLVHSGAIPDGVVDGRLAQAVDAYAPAAEPPRVDTCGFAVFLDQAPRRLAIQVPGREPESAWRQGTEEGAFTVVLDAGRLDVGEDWPGGV